MPIEVPLELLAEAIRGALGVGVTASGLEIRRLPEWTTTQFGEDRFLDVVSRHGSGVRLELETAASWLELTGRWNVLQIDGASLPTATIIVETDDGATIVPIPVGGGVDHVGPSGVTHEPGGETVLRLELPAASGVRQVTVWLPVGARVVIAGARADAPVGPRPQARPRWVHYGSSISHCLEAENPFDVWPVVVARTLHLDLINLGLAGECHLDQFVARAIRDAAPDVVTLKVGINIVIGATMTARTLRSALHGFLDTLREALPATPVIVISPIFSPDFENAGRPASSEQHDGSTNSDRLTLQATRALLEEIVVQRATTDDFLSYLDGLELLGFEDADLLPDRLHPSPAGYQAIARRFLAASTHLSGFAHSASTTTPGTAADRNWGQSR